MSNFYNEIDRACCDLLSNLMDAGAIPAGVISDKSIVDIRPDDLVGVTHAHWFAGIGGWAYGLKLAGWPDDRPVWTGSCPCQPWSRANTVWKRGKAREDDRHLWPFWRDLIHSCRPPIVFGEQVTEAITLGWLDEVFDDMERDDYSCGAAVIPALGVGSPQERERLWFVCHTNEERHERLSLAQAIDGTPGSFETWCEITGTTDPYRGKRWTTKPGVHLLVDGVPGGMGRLGMYGNAVVPQVAAEFVRAYGSIREPLDRHEPQAYQS